MACLSERGHSDSDVEVVLRGVQYPGVKQSVYSGAEQKGEVREEWLLFTRGITFLIF